MRHNQIYRFLLSRAVSILALLHLFIFIFVSAISQTRLKVLYGVIVALATLIEYGYMHGLGRFSNPNSIYTALIFNESEIWIDAILAHLSLFAIVPIVGYILFLWQVKLAAPYGIKLSTLLVLFTVSLYSVLYFFTQYHGPFLNTSVGNFMQTTIFMPWYYSKTIPQMNSPREAVTYQTTTPPTNNIIFIVDESIRGDHLSLNGYTRSTTPYLDELAKQGYLYNWGVTVSGGTCSQESNMLLFTGLPPAAKEAIYTAPSIFQYAKAMGYTVHYYDGSNTDKFWFGKPSDSQYTDVWRNASVMEHTALYDTDFAIAREIKALVHGSIGHFIWVNKRGVHFNYARYYPPEAAVWQPALGIYANEDIGNIKIREREQLVNAYDNGILYNVNGFFRTLIEPSVLDHSTIIYTADHGQTLSDNGEHWTHCRDSKNEAVVPLFIITQNDYTVDTDYQASHQNIFPTLLELMKVPSTARARSYALSLFTATAADSTDRYYYAHKTGHIHNFDADD